MLSEVAALFNLHRSPSGLPFIGHALELRRDPLSMLTGLAEEQGEIAEFRLPFLRGFLLSNPDHIQEVFNAKDGRFPRSPLYQRVAPFFGQGLITTEGEVWRNQRLMVQPSFKGEKLRGMLGLMRQATEDFSDQLATRSPGRAINVAVEMAELSLTIACKTLFGWDIGDRVRSLSSHTMETWKLLSERAVGLLPFPMWAPTTTNSKLATSIGNMERTVYAMINARRRHPTEDGTLLAALITGTTKDGVPLTDLQIRDHIMTFILAGHETTSTTLAWALWLLTRHPEWVEWIRTEAGTLDDKRIMNMRGDAEPTAAMRVILETLRLYPPIWTLDRSTTKPEVIRGRDIPKDSILMLSPWVMHRNHRHWSAPERFDPDRFSLAASHGRPPYAFFPFGGGGHSCIGKRFALIEAQIMLSILLTRFDITLVPGQCIVPEPLLTLRPSNNSILISFTPRT